MLCHRLYRFHSIPTLRHNLDLWMTLQHFPQQFPRQLFVIHNQRFPLAIRRAHDLPSASAGNDRLTRNTSSSAFASRCASCPYRASSLLCTFFNPTPSFRDDTASGSQEFSTATPILPAIRVACTRIHPPSGNCAIPCTTAFSTNGCSSSGGTTQSFVSSAISSFTVNRSPNRTFSIAQYFSSSANSSLSGISAFSPIPSVIRKKSASNTHISRARAGSMLVSALIEFRLLYRKCGLICAFSAFNSASRARTLDSSALA